MACMTVSMWAVLHFFAVQYLYTSDPSNLKLFLCLRYLWFLLVKNSTYCIPSNRSRVSNTSRISSRSQGSKSLIQIEAGSHSQAGGPNHVKWSWSLWITIFSSGAVPNWSSLNSEATVAVQCLRIWNRQLTAVGRPGHFLDPVIRWATAFCNGNDLH